MKITISRGIQPCDDGLELTERLGTRNNHSDMMGKQYDVLQNNDYVSPGRSVDCWFGWLQAQLDKFPIDCSSRPIDAGQNQIHRSADR
jgi:hypothetical protein